jgi:hypothetical protein
MTAKKIKFEIIETTVRSGKIQREERSICERRIGQAFDISSLGVLILLVIVAHARCVSETLQVSFTLLS